MALLYLINKIYYVPEAKIGMYIPSVIDLLKLEILIVRRDSEAAWKKKCYESLAVIMSFFWVQLWAVYIIVTWPVCVHKWRLGKKVELWVGEENKCIKIGVVSQRFYNDWTEGHCSPGWVCVSFFFVSSSTKIPFVAFSWPKVWMLKNRDAATCVLFMDPEVVVARGKWGQTWLMCNLIRTQNPVHSLFLLTKFFPSQGEKLSGKKMY